MKLVAVDLDGTLLNDKGEISRYTQDMIEKLKDTHMIVPSTSRSHLGLPKSLLETKIPYYICSNGAVIWDNNQKSIISSESLATMVVKNILSNTKDIEKAVSIVNDGIVYSESKLIQILKKHSLNDNMISKITENREMVDNVDVILNNIEQVEKLHMNFDDMEAKQRCIDIIPVSNAYTITSSSKGNIEITHREATKGKAVLKLCQLLNIKNSDIMAFGDNLNDIATFEVAKIKVAMCNGNEELKKLATHISEYSNDEDGVLRFLLHNSDEKETM